VLGTIPAAVVGFALAGWVESNLRDPSVIVVTLSGYAVLMFLADRFGRRERNISGIHLRDALVIGCAQALALIPGTSRSGVTISAARILGFARLDAARFSFLLAVPVILLATVYELGGLIVGEAPVAWDRLGTAALISAIVAYASIDFFMRIVSRIGLLPFSLYRLALAAVILYVLV
jgi:undecaprenyl-diphosphatase